MLQEHLWMAGPIVYPLLFCSILTLALIIERCISLCLYPAVKPLNREQIINSQAKRGLAVGLQLLNSNKQHSKQYRDELASHWLQSEKRFLFTRTRWLTLLGAISPLLGLLGTVLGIITMFQDVAHVAGPVTPAILAGGMWEAMVTTAIGMMIAIPAIVAAQTFTMWSDHRIAVMAECLNEYSLALSANSDNENIIHPAAFNAGKTKGQTA